MSSRKLPKRDGLRNVTPEKPFKDADVIPTVVLHRNEQVVKHNVRRDCKREIRGFDRHERDAHRRGTVFGPTDALEVLRRGDLALNAPLGQNHFTIRHMRAQVDEIDHKARKHGPNHIPQTYGLYPSKRIPLSHTKANATIFMPYTGRIA
ncbi:hypothetical protein PsorP6_003165 [Peronosclerospora sorghi]|uniref:Uncharacterized protein n=1 Tax=Peronosclerospora sorghi TaxID=230839 RepID=A0ACC0VLX4_9STRA|nr:hypothetical protein PsorP6_003165 [Peronosclerospora sorghi]